MALLMGSLAFWSGPAHALTANQVAFEFRPNGLFRVYLYYTVPSLKEFREAYVEFASRKQAEEFYFKVVRGGDFYLEDPDRVDFINRPLEPSPW
jgi:hypothetical protein